MSHFKPHQSFYVYTRIKIVLNQTVFVHDWGIACTGNRTSIVYNIDLVLNVFYSSIKCKRKELDAALSATLPSSYKDLGQYAMRVIG